MKVKCPACNKIWDASQSFCEVCGTSLAGVTPTNEEELQSSVQVGASGGVGKMCNCGATLKGDEESCPYCNQKQNANSGGRQVVQHPITKSVSIEWPWGGESLHLPLFIGRVPPAPLALGLKLETEYPNVSRMHAELFEDNGQLRIRDYSSTNGTFVNDKKLDPYIARILANGDTVRFGNKLTMRLTHFSS